MGRSEHVISIKSRRPRRRFSLLPLVVFIATFLPWASLPSLRRHAAAGARFHKLARPSATARLRSHHVQQLPPFWIGLAWGSRSQVLIEFYGIVYGTLSLSEFSASVRSFVSVCTLRRAFKPSCFSPLVPVRARCWQPSHPGEVAICQRPSGPLPPPSTLNKPCSSNTSPWSGCARLCSSRCTLACSLQPHYTPVPSPAADDTCMRTGQGPFQGRPERI